MTEIEQKALALVNEVLVEWGVMKNAVEVPKNSDAFARALLRAIEKHEAFKQDLSDAVEHCRACSDPEAWTRIKFELERFIIPKPDPLAEAWIEATGNAVGMGPLNEALAKRGLKIVEIER